MVDSVCRIDNLQLMTRPKSGMVFIVIIFLNLKQTGMKKYFIVIVLFSATFFACNNNKKSEAKDSETYRTVPVPNVNGNIPDTNNSIDLSTKKTDSSHLKIDSSHVKTDSLQKGK